MFSIMITVESTTIPKSTAPSEIRLAGVPVPTMPMKAIISASGMLSAVMMRRPPVTEKEPEHQRHQHHPHQQVLDHGVGGQLDQVGAVVIGLDVHPGRQDVVVGDLVDLVVDVVERLQRVAAVAHEDRPLHDVGVEILPHDPQARRMPDRDVGDVAHADGRSVLLGDDHLADVGQRTKQAEGPHVERLLAHRQPLPADVLVGVRQRGHQLIERQAVPLQAKGVDLDVVLLGEAAVPDHVDDAGGLAELPLEDPVLRRLAVGQRVVLAAHDVAVDLADRAPGRELRRHPRRQRDEVEPVQHPLLGGVVVGVPGEVALHVGQAEQRLRTDVVEIDHPVQAVLERDGHVALDLLGAPAVRLGDDLDHRRHRVGVGLDVELLVAVEPERQQAARQDQHERRHPQNETDQTLQHGAPRAFRRAGSRPR